jgi:hypothetical protein
MRKLITLTLAVLMVGLFAAVVFAAVEAGDDPSSTVGTTETSPTTDTTDTTETETTPTTTTEAPDDISGPCDEAEHSGDPRCTGGPVPREDDDHSGRGRGGDDDFDDHSGRGRGGDDFDDHSGRGRGGDDEFHDDHSGSGHGGDDDNSGPGGGD